MFNHFLHSPWSAKIVCMQMLETLYIIMLKICYPMFCKIWRTASFVGSDLVLICTKTSYGSTCPACGVHESHLSQAKKSSQYIPWNTVSSSHWHEFNVSAELWKWVPVIRGMKRFEREYSNLLIAILVKIGWNCHCMLDNCKTNDQISSGH